MKPFIYISYAWGDNPDSQEEQAVTGLCKTLDDYGFEVVIDRTHSDYHKTLLDFFRIIGYGGIVIPIIGKKYFSRINCLIEASNMIIRGDITERIFPLVLSDCYEIYDVFKRPTFINEIELYWKNKEQELLEAIDFNDTHHHKIPIRPDLNILNQIISIISDFIFHIGTSMQFNFDDELKTEFKEFVEYIIKETRENFEQAYYQKIEGDYFGREDDVKFIDDFLIDETKNFLLLYGIGGMGKSHLISHCLNKYNYKRKFFWVKADENFELKDLFKSCNIRFPKELQSTKEICRQFLNEFTSKNLFLIIDDWYEIIDVDVRGMLPDLACLPKGKLLIISRAIPVEIKNQTVYCHELPPLEINDFINVMNFYRISTNKRILTNNELTEIFNKAQGYPLGGQLIIRLMDFGDNLSEILIDIPKFEAERDEEGKKFSERLLDNIFKKGNKEEIKLLCEFSALFGFSTLDLVRNLPSYNLKFFDTLVNRRRFISNDGTDKYSSHAMIKDYAYDKLEDKESTHAKLGRYFETRLRESKEVDWNLIESAIQQFSHVNQKELIDFGKRIKVQFGLNDVMTLIEENAKNTIRNIKSMLAFNPEEPYYIHRLGMAYRSNGNIDLAIATFKRLLALEPDNPVALNELGISFRKRNNDGDIDIAIATFERAIKKNPDNIPSYNELALSYMERKKDGDIDLAITAFKHLVDLEPINVILLFQLGICYHERRKVRDLDLAIACFKKAIAIHGDDVRLLLKLSNSYRERNKEGDLNLEIASLERAVSIESDNFKLLIELGHEYRRRKRKGDYDLAITAFEKANTIEPNNVIVLIQLGFGYRIRKEKGDFDLAITIFKKALTIEPNNVRALYELGICYRTRGRKDDLKLAFDNFNKALAIENNNVDVLINLGYCHIISYKHFRKKKDLDLALGFLNKSIAIDSKNTKGFSLMGRIYFYRKDYINSIKFCEKAIEIDPTNIQAYAISQSAYSLLNKFWEATDVIKRGLKIKPQDILLLKIKEKLINEGKWEEER